MLVNDGLAIAVLITQVLIILFFGAYVVSKIIGKPLKLPWLATYRNWISCGIALIATLGSLYFSKILEYVPCELCWYQRIAMYPLVILFAVAIIKKEQIQRLVVPLLLIGAVIAGYHYSTQFLGTEAFCKIGEISCALKVEMHYGYMTIPLMAFTAFVAILIVQLYKVQMSTVTKKRKKRRI